MPVLPTGSAATAQAGSGVKQQQADSRGGSWDGAGGGGRTEAKRKRRQEREKHAVVLDEIAPKETGRQAIAVRHRERFKGIILHGGYFFSPESKALFV